MGLALGAEPPAGGPQAACGNHLQNGRLAMPRLAAQCAEVPQEDSHVRALPETLAVMVRGGLLPGGLVQGALDLVLHELVRISFVQVEFLAVGVGPPRCGLGPPADVHQRADDSADGALDSAPT